MPMIQVVNNIIMRDGVKIGWVDGDHILDRGGNKIAYFSGTEAYGADGTKIAYMAGEYVVFPRNNTKVRIEDIDKLVSGLVSDICRAAIRLVLG